MAYLALRKKEMHRLSVNAKNVFVRSTMIFVLSREKRDKELDKETKGIGLKPLQP